MHMMGKETPRTQRWDLQAACAGKDTALFFPPRGSNGLEAKAICAGCTVTHPCLIDALATGDRGVRGGLTHQERRGLAAKHGVSKQRAVAPCGTTAGHKRHMREHTPPCDGCRNAMALYRAQRRAVHGRTA